MMALSGMTVCGDISCGMVVIIIIMPCKNVCGIRQWHYIDVVSNNLVSK